MGFQKGKSTILALLSGTHDWLTQLDNKKDVCCIFFDFQKAFDTVPHKNLMDKLSQLEFHPLILKWIHSYLRNREQHVVVKRVASSSIPVISGVPQGSVLGPLLFLIYIDGISLLKFSDDSKLSQTTYFFIKSSHLMLTISISSMTLTGFKTGHLTI